MWRRLCITAQPVMQTPHEEMSLPLTRMGVLKELEPLMVDTVLSLRAAGVSSSLTPPQLAANDSLDSAALAFLVVCQLEHWKERSRKRRRRSSLVWERRTRSFTRGTWIVQGLGNAMLVKDRRDGKVLFFMVDEQSENTAAALLVTPHPWQWVFALCHGHGSDLDGHLTWKCAFLCASFSSLPRKSL